MRLEVLDAELLDIEEFLETCRREVFVPITEEQVRAVPASFRRFVADSRALLDSRLYVASDTDPNRERWLTPNDDVPRSERRLITFAELMQAPRLLRDYLAMLADGRAGRPERESPHVMTLHCSTCDARWMLDGNHGFARLCAEGAHGPVTVTEMTDPRLGIRACAC